MSRVPIFLTFIGHFYVTVRKFDMGHRHFDSVEICSFLIDFYGIHFVSIRCALSQKLKSGCCCFSSSNVLKNNLPTSSISFCDIEYCDVSMTLHCGRHY